MARGVSVISVGRKPVVPKRRCAAPIAAIPSTVGVVVEQHAAAAIHLHVDEARRDQALDPARARAGGHVALGDDRGDRGAVDDHGAAVEQTRAVEDACAGEGERAHEPPTARCEMLLARRGEPSPLSIPERSD